MKRGMVKRGLSIMLACAMLITEAHVTAFATEDIILSDENVIADENGTTEEGNITDREEAVVTDEASAESITDMSEDEIKSKLEASADAAEHPGGVFGFAETMITLEEGSSEGVIRVVRAGNTDNEASVVFKAVDVSTEYGRDYTLKVVEDELKESELPDNPDMKPLLAEYGEVITEDDEEDSAAKESADETTDKAADMGVSSLANAYKAQTGEDAPSYDWKEYTEDTVSEEHKAIMDAGYEQTREELAALDGVSVKLQFAPGEYMKEIKVDVKDDGRSESEEQILFVLQDASGAEIGAHDNGYVNITDDDDTEVSTYCVKEKNYIVGTDESKALVTIVRTSGIDRLDIVTVGTKAETAKADEDYESVIKSVLFAPGVTEKTVEVNITSHDRSELKNFWVGIKSDSGAVIENNACLVSIAGGEYELEESYFTQEVDPDSLSFDGGAAADEILPTVASADKRADIPTDDIEGDREDTPIVGEQPSFDDIVKCTGEYANYHYATGNIWPISDGLNISNYEYVRVWYYVGGYTHKFWYDYAKKRVTVYLYDKNTGKLLASKDRDHENKDSLPYSITIYKNEVPNWDQLTNVEVRMYVKGTSESGWQEQKDIYAKGNNIRLSYYKFKMTIDNNDESYNHYTERRYTGTKTYTDAERVNYPYVWLVAPNGWREEAVEYKKGDPITTITDESRAGRNSLGIRADKETVDFKGFKLKKNSDYSTDLIPAYFKFDNDFLNKYRDKWMDSDYNFTLVPVFEPKKLKVSFDNGEAKVGKSSDYKGHYNGYSTEEIMEDLTKLDTMTVTATANESAGYFVRGIGIGETDIKKGTFLEYGSNSSKGDPGSFTTHLAYKPQYLLKFVIHYDDYNLKVMYDPAAVKSYEKDKDGTQKKDKDGNPVFLRDMGQVIHVDENNKAHVGNYDKLLTLSRVGKGRVYNFGAMTGGNEKIESSENGYLTYWRDGTLDNDEDGYWEEDKSYNQIGTTVSSMIGFVPMRTTSRLYYSFVPRPNMYEQPATIKGWLQTKERLLMSQELHPTDVISGINGATITVDGKDTVTQKDDKGNDGYYEIDNVSLYNRYFVTTTYDGPVGSFAANYATEAGSFPKVSIDIEKDLAISDVKAFVKDDKGNYTACAADAFMDGYYTALRNGDHDYKIEMTATSNLGSDIATGQLQFYYRDGVEVADAISGTRDTGTKGRFIFEFNPAKLFLHTGLIAKVKFTDTSGHTYYERNLGILLTEETGPLNVVNAFTVGKPGIAVDIIGAVNWLMDAGWTCKFDGSAEAGVTYENARSIITVGMTIDLAKKFSSDDNVKKATDNLAKQGSKVAELKKAEEDAYKKYISKDGELADWTAASRKLEEARVKMKEAKDAFDKAVDGASTAGRAKDFKVGGMLTGKLNFGFVMSLNLDSNGKYYFDNMTMTAGIAVGGKCTIKYTTPIAITLGLTLELGGEGSACFIVKDTGTGKYYVDETSAKAYNIWNSDNFTREGIFNLKPYIVLSLSAGLLDEEVISVTIDAKVAFDMVFATAGDGYGDMTLSGGIDIKITLFHFRKEFGSDRTDMWGKSPKSLQLEGAVMDALEGDNLLYAPGSELVPEDVSYMSGGSRWYGGKAETPIIGAIDDEGSAYIEKALADKIGETPDFDMISLGKGRYAAVFLNVPADKINDSMNSRAVYYTLFDGTSWAEPVKLEEDGNLDYFPRIYSLGSRGGLIIWSSVYDKDAVKDQIDMLNGFNLHGEFIDASGRLSGKIMEITKNTVDARTVSGNFISDDYSDRYSDVAADVAANDDGILVYYSKKEYKRSEKSGEYYLGDVLYPATTVMAARYYDYSTEKWADGAETAESLNLIVLSEPERSARVEAYNTCMYGQKFFDYLPGVMLEEEIGDDGYLKEGTVTKVIKVDNSSSVLLDTDAASYGNKGIFAYSMDIDGDLTTDADREVYYQVYDFASKEFKNPVIVTGNGENDSEVRLVKAGGGLWLTWLSNGDIVSLDLSFLFNHENELLINGDGYSYINKAKPAAETAVAWPRISTVVRGTVGDQGEEGNRETVSQITEFDVKASDKYMYFMWPEVGVAVKDGIDPDSSDAKKAENAVSEKQLYALRAEIGHETYEGVTYYGLNNLTDAVQVTSKSGVTYDDVAFEVADDGKLLGLAWKAPSRLKTVEEAKADALAGGVEFNEAVYVPYSVTDKEHAVPVTFSVDTTSVLKIKDAGFVNADVMNGAGITFSVLNDGFDTVADGVIVKAVDENNKSVLIGEDGEIVDSLGLDGLIGGASDIFNGHMDLNEDAKSAKVTITLMGADGTVLKTKEITTELKEDLNVSDVSVENTGIRGEYLVKGKIENTGGAKSAAGKVDVSVTAGGTDRLLSQVDHDAIMPGETLDFETIIKAEDSDFAVTKDEEGSVTETLTVCVKTQDSSMSAAAERFAYGKEVETVQAIQDIGLELPTVVGEEIALKPDVKSSLAYEENVYLDENGNNVKGLVTGGESLQYIYECDSDCIEIDPEGVARAVKEGTGKIRLIAYYADREKIIQNPDPDFANLGGFSDVYTVDGYPKLASAAVYEKEITFTISEVRDKKFTDKKGVQYQITSLERKEVTVTGLDPEYVKAAKKPITSVSIPASVKYIDNDGDDKDLSGTYTVVSIDISAFAGNTSIKKVSVAKNVKLISSGAFKGCTALTGVSLGADVAVIGANAFEGCTGLKSINIPGNVHSIGEKAFYGCSLLKSVNVKSTELKSVGADAFTGIDKNAAFKYSVKGDAAKASLKLLFTKEGEKFTDKKGITYVIASLVDDTVIVKGLDPEYVKALKKPVTSVSIPATVKYKGVQYKVSTIYTESFMDNKTIKSVSIGKNVTIIGDGAFAGCTALTKASGAAGVVTIGASAFEGCSALKSVSLQKKLATISKAAFKDCTALKSVTIPANVTGIGSEAFRDCSGVKTVTIRSGVLTSIGNDAFKGIVEDAVIKLSMKKDKKEDVKKLFTPETGVTDKMKIKL